MVSSFHASAVADVTSSYCYTSFVFCSYARLGLVAKTERLRLTHNADALHVASQQRPSSE